MMMGTDAPGREKEIILIVDDTPMNIRILAQALVGRYDVKVAASGRAAMDIARGREIPDLILLDIMMPEMDGFEVCRRLKQDPKTQNIPIIFISAKDEVSDQQQGFNLGAVDYITKPFELPLVLARINVHLRLKRKSEQLERFAMIDAGTDIPNRRALDDTLDRECRRAERDGTDLTVLMIDVDHFKAFNDHYGHGAGDECLRQVAKTVASKILRPGDFVGRYGGEEFVAVLPDCGRRDGEKIAEKIRSGIEQLAIPHRHSGTADHVTISIGIGAVTPRGKKTASSLLAEADQMLYRAKIQGRNRTCSVGAVQGLADSSG